ncbi:metallophosphoesterase [Candidatus Woesearchaeota archaeon]|nr:MAG: metallophosphoesterase [Candidatus Woesearchaeota archaeon]
MNRFTMTLLFILTFLALCIAIHVYVLSTLAHFFSITKTPVFYLGAAFLALAFVLISILERKFHGHIMKMLYLLSAVLIGIVFFFLIFIVIHDILSLFITIPPYSAGIVISVLVALLTIISLINASSFRVKEIKLPMAVSKETTIVQLTDLHLGPVRNEEYLSKVVKKINELNPDMVLITGDLCDGNGKFDKDTVAPLNQINAKTFFSTGNHEDIEGIEKMTAILSTTKVIMLRNTDTVYKDIQIIGVDNPPFEKKWLADALKKIKMQNVPRILMYHPPQEFEIANSLGINLQLSGHTHSGQIFPFELFVRLFYPRVHGLYHHKGSYLYVSPGTGTWGPPMRLGTRNEITLFRLIPDADTSRIQ